MIYDWFVVHLVDFLSQRTDQQHHCYHQEVHQLATSVIRIASDPKRCYQVAQHCGGLLGGSRRPCVRFATYNERRRVDHVC